MADKEKMLSKTEKLEKDAEKLVSEIQTSEGHETPQIVDWDGPNDHANPMNWSLLRKWITIGLVSFNTLNVYVTASIFFLHMEKKLVTSNVNLNRSMASTLFAPGIPNVLSDFDSTNSAIASFMVSVFTIGFIFGPLILSPLSEIYGRLPITHFANVVFLWRLFFAPLL